MHQPSTIWLLLIITLGAMLLLFGCAGTIAITDGEVAQTAVAQGCWSVDTRPSPLPVTVTQIGVRPTAAHGGAATVTTGSTATARATTTPLPRCTPMPGQTLAPYPTTIPTEPPYPTRPVNAAQPEADGKVVMRLPNAVLSADIAVHMQGSWPVVAAIDIPTLNQGPTQVFARVYNPMSNQWTLARTVDGDGTHPGGKFRSVAVGITPDGVAHVVWGVSDYPEQAMYYSRSSDYGVTWSTPERIGIPPMFAVLDVATTLQNEVYALVLAPSGRAVMAALLRRDAAGVWRRELLPQRAIWYGSRGALAVTGDGNRIVALITADDSRPGGVWTFARPLAGGTWDAQAHTPPDGEGGIDGTSASVVVYPYRVGRTTVQGVSFAVTHPSGVMDSISSLDGGATWGNLTAIAHGNGWMTSGSIAYDPAAQRLIAVWSCCADASWGSAPATHYAAWADPAGGPWTPAAADPAAHRAPLVSGAASASLTQLAHAANAERTWLLWLEDGHTLMARSYSSARIIPREQYPTATPGGTP